MFWYISGALRAGISAIVLLTHTTQRWRYHSGRGGWNATLALYNILYIYFILDGAWYLFLGSWRIHLLNAPNGPAVLLTGAASMAPYLAVLSYGHQKLFKVMARRFEKKRRGLDSALIAELMNDPAIECGAEWWIHHGNNLIDEYPDPVDHRANWTRAVIVEVQRNEYAINLNVEQKKLDVGNTNGNDGAQQGGGGGFVSGVRRLRSITGTRSRRNVVGGIRRTNTLSPATNKVAPAPAARQWVPLPDSFEQNAVDLLNQAHDKLRALDGRYLTHGLMQR